MQKPKIGFIGLGLMGSAMVERLQSLGYELIVKGNRNRQKIEEAVSRGAVDSVSAKQMAERVEIVMFCVDNSQSVESNIYGDAGVLSGVKRARFLSTLALLCPLRLQRLQRIWLREEHSTWIVPLGEPQHTQRMAS